MATPHTIRFIYYGRLAENNTQILRNAGLAGVLSRSLEYRANVVNAMQIATQRGYRVIEELEAGQARMDAIRMELDSDAGSFSALGAVVLDKPRLLQVENISCEATLDGNLMYSKNEDVPGVIGFLGTVLGKNGINIANFALGRQEPSARKDCEPAHRHIHCRDRPTCTRRCHFANIQEYGCEVRAPRGTTSRIDQCSTSRQSPL